MDGWLPSRVAGGFRGSLCAIMTSIAAKKREAARLQKKRSQALEDQLRRVRSRRLIVLGSLMEKEYAPADLIDKLDQALDRDQGLALFDLPPRSAPDQPPPSAPLSGWTPAKLADGDWGARFQGDTPTLPDNLKGRTISVRTRSGDVWDSTITEVVERSPDRVLVRTRKLDP